MGTVTKLNDVLCANISKVSDVLKANASKWDDNTFCPSGPTPTPTPTPTATPTPTPTPTCVAECCPTELCYDKRDCNGACQCNDTSLFYLHLPCGGDCFLSNADGIFLDDLCTSPMDPAYFVDGKGECWYWDGSTLTFDTYC
jgi:hypothetical protein